MTDEIKSEFAHFLGLEWSRLLEDFNLNIE